MAIKTNADVALKYSEGMRDTDAEKFKAIASASNQMTSLIEVVVFVFGFLIEFFTCKKLVA